MHFLSFFTILLSVANQTECFSLKKSLRNTFGIASRAISSSKTASKAVQKRTQDVTVNLPKEAADALTTFFNQTETFSNCPKSLGGNGKRGVERRDDATKFDCFYSIHKEAVAMLSSKQLLEPIFKQAKDVIINIEDQPAYTDLEVAKAQVVSFVAGAKMIETQYPGTDTRTSNKLMSAIFLATHARLLANVLSFSYYSVSATYLTSNNNNGHCLVGTDIECPNPLCNGDGGLCREHTAFFGCPCKPFVCPDLDDTPYCTDCGGDKGGSTCMGVPQGGKYFDCHCLVSQNPPPWSFVEHGFTDPGPFVANLGKIGPPLPATPQCNGLDNGKYVDPDPAIAAVQDFCGNANRRKAPGFDVGGGNVGFQTKNYNPNSPNDLDLKITFFDHIDIAQDDCEIAFKEIINGCDGNDEVNNPSSFKHGGSFSFHGGQTGGAVFEVIPKVKQYRRACNLLTSDRWMCQDQLATDIQDFCLWAVHDSASTRTYNVGTPNEVILSVKWGKAPKSTQDCTTELNHISDDCGGSALPHGILGGKDGPGNFKHGGVSVPAGQAIYQIQPQRNTNCGSVPDMKCKWDFDCAAIQCPSGREWYTGRCIDGGCGCAKAKDGRTCPS